MSLPLIINYPLIFACKGQRRKTQMKNLSLVLAAFLICGLTVIACSPEKKSKKSPAPSTITVEVTPSEIGEITVSTPIALTAVVKNNGTVQPNASVNWVVVNKSTSTDILGTCAPNQGASTVFTADMSKQGQGYIAASYNGTESNRVDFSIGEPTLTIDSIEITALSPTTITSSETIKFKATAKAGTTSITTPGTEITWTATNGKISSPAKSQSGSGEVTFTPDAAGPATVTAHYGATVSASVNITVTGGTTPPPVSDDIILYKDGVLGSLIDTTAINNCLYTEAGTQYPGTPNSAMSMSDVTDPTTCWQLSFTMGGALAADHNGDGNYGGFFMRFASSQDLTEYNYLCFDMKGTVLPIAGSTVQVEMNKTGKTLVDNPATPTSSWQSYKIDISGKARSSVTEPINIIFSRRHTGGGTATGTSVGADPTAVIRINNIRFTKN
jgi:hypothetical protein